MEDNVHDYGTGSNTHREGGVVSPSRAVRGGELAEGEDGEERVEKKKKEKNSIFEMRKSLNNDKKEESTFFSDLGIIIKNPVFLMGIVVRAVLYGVNTALHFWISDYMRTALNINDSFQILISYSIIAVTGPLGGVLASSFVSFFLGGYEHKNSAGVGMLFIMVVACVGLVFIFVLSVCRYHVLKMQDKNKVSEKSREGIEDEEEEKGDIEMKTKE